jgi:hypothetical protein
MVMRTPVDSFIPGLYSGKSAAPIAKLLIAESKNKKSVFSAETSHDSVTISRLDTFFSSAKGRSHV